MIYLFLVAVRAERIYIYSFIWIVGPRHFVEVSTVVAFVSEGVAVTVKATGIISIFFLSIPGVTGQL
jgi:hypothetical protein